MKHISVYAKFSLKGVKQPGISQEDWVFGKEKPLSFDVMVGVFAAQLAKFFLNTGLLNIEEINQAIQKAGDQVKTISFTAKLPDS